MNLKEYRSDPVHGSGKALGKTNFSKKMVVEIDRSMCLSGDLYFRLKHKGSFKNKLICRFALNTSFVNDK